MGFFDFFRRRPPVQPKPPTGGKEVPVDLMRALQVMNQESVQYWKAPSYSVSGQPQYWVWAPKAIANATPGSWQANWNALPPVMRAAYGVAVVNPSGASWSLNRSIYEQLEGHTPEQGAELVTVNTENFRKYRIENGQLVHLWLNNDGTMTRTVIADLAYPDAPVNVLTL